jgi:hypothetical protein
MQLSYHKNINGGAKRESERLCVGEREGVGGCVGVTLCKRESGRERMVNQIILICSC